MPVLYALGQSRATVASDWPGQYQLAIEVLPRIEAQILKAVGQVIDACGRDFNKVQHSFDFVEHDRLDAFRAGGVGELCAVGVDDFRNASDLGTCKRSESGIRLVDSKAHVLVVLERREFQTAFRKDSNSALAIGVLKRCASHKIAQGAGERTGVMRG